MNDNRLAGLSSQANTSLQESLYIAALDRYLGIRGLISPVTDEETGLPYDFFHPETGCMIKVFKTLDQHDIVSYTKKRFDQCVFIVDAVALETMACEGCGEEHANIKSEELFAAAQVLELLLYADDQLWRLEDEGCEWAPITPIERNRCIEALYNMAKE